MSAWPRRVQLGDVTHSHDGERISLSPRQCSARPGDYPYYGPGGIIARIDRYVYEGEYLLASVLPQVPRAVLARGRFSASPRVHVLSCDPGAAPAFLCEVLNAAPPPDRRLSAPRPGELKKLEALEFFLPGPEIQRLILRALSAMEDKTALLRDQNRVLYGMLHSLFDRFFIFGPGRRPLGDLAGCCPADSPAPEKNRGGSVFFNLFLYAREGLHPLFITALIKNPEFLSYAEGCMEGGMGKRRLDGEGLMAFQLSGPAENRPSGAYREFNGFAETAEKKLAANHEELRVLQKLRQNLIPV
jgi:hypothetical protein